MSAPVNIHSAHHRRTSSVLSHNAFSWTDAFEFSARSPTSFTAPLDMEAQYASACVPQMHQAVSFVPTFGVNTPALTAINLGMACSPPTEEFEKDYCSNFNCCNKTLPDMHALIAHVDEAHFGSGFQNSPYTQSFPPNTSSTAAAPTPMKPPMLNVDTTNAGLVGVNANGANQMDMDVETSATFGESMGVPHDAPSPYSSVGPETPPPQSFEVSSMSTGSQNKAGSSSPEMDRISAPTPMYGAHSNSLAVFSHMNANGRSSAPIPPFQRTSPFSHSPFAHSSFNSSPLSGSPASYASSGPAGYSDDSIPVLSMSSAPMAPTQAPSDILLDFNMFDDMDDLPTPLDSTPPSPLSAPTRVRPVLRHAHLAQPVTNNSIGLPPSLFSTYDYLRVEGDAAEADMDDDERERKEREREAREKDERRKAERRERDRERRERQRAAERERLAAINGGDASDSSSGGGVVRREREKARKNSAIGLAPAPPAGTRSVPVSPVTATFATEEQRRGSEGTTALSAESSTPQRAAALAAAASAAQLAGNKKGNREKMYKCLKPGCTKSYLNPNGLKYHTLKGTCTFAEKPNNVLAPGSTTSLPGSAPLTPLSTTPVCSAPGTPSPQAMVNAPMQLPVPFTIATLGAEAQQQMQQAFAQGFPAFNISGVPLIAPPMPLQAQPQQQQQQNTASVPTAMSV